MSDISNWEVFAKVVELKSLSAAGRELRLTAAVVSSRIATIERKLGVRLLNRTTRRVNATEEGEIFYEHCLRIIDEIQAIETTIGTRSAAPRGSITVTAPAGFGRKHVAPYLLGFVERNAGLSVRLHLTDRLTDVIAEGTDVAIRIADLKNYSFIAKKLANNERVVVGAPDYLKTHGAPDKPNDLLSHNCLLLRFPGSKQYQWTLKNEAGKSVTLQVSGNLDSDNGDALTDWCLAGAGLTVKSLWEVGEHIRNGRLQIVLPEWKPLGHAIYAIYPHSRLMPPRVRTFIDYLAEVYGPNPPWVSR
ncbi:MAG: LysR family transcriptional regulator [Hyphomicrobiales bacterium]